MKHLLWLSLGLVLLFPLIARADQRIYGFCQDGGQNVNTQGLLSTNLVQASYPGCTVSVFNTGTNVLASIYADNARTVKSNPFTAPAGDTSTWFFYIPSGTRVDIQLTGGTPAFPSPVTLGDVLGNDNSVGPVLNQCVVTFSSTLSFTANSCGIFSMTLTGNVSSSTITGGVAGQVVNFSLCQDATGGRTFAWPASFLNPPTIDTTASRCGQFSFVLLADSNWHQLGSGESTAFLNVKTSNATVTGAITAQSSNNDLCIGPGPGQYSSMAACYAAASSGQTCDVSSNWAETLSVNLVMSKNNVGFRFHGAATITMGSNQLIVNDGVAGAFISSPATTAFSIQAGAHFIYTGNASAFVFGTSSATTQLIINLTNVFIDLTSAGSSAAAITGYNAGLSTWSNLAITGAGGGTNQLGIVAHNGSAGHFGNLVISQSTIVGVRTAIQLNDAVQEATFIGTQLNGSAVTGASTGIDIEGSSQSNGFFGGTSTGYSTAINFGGASSNNYISIETDTATTDVAFGASTANNEVFRVTTGGGSFTVSSGGTSNIVRGPGGIVLSGQYLAPIGAASLPGYAFSGHTNSGLFFNGAGLLQFTAAGTPSVEIGSAGTAVGSGQSYLMCSGTDPGAGSCDTGMNRDSAGVLDFGNGLSKDTTGKVQAAGYISGGTTFTSNGGCTESALQGGATGGSFKVGQNTACTIVITMGNSATAGHGWTCSAYDETGTPAVAIRQTAHTTTSCSLLMTVATNDIIVFSASGWK